MNGRDLDELEQLTAQFAELMYPGMEIISDLSDDDGDAMVRKARTVACRIADLVITSGLLREVTRR